MNKQCRLITRIFNMAETLQYDIYHVLRDEEAKEQKHATNLGFEPRIFSLTFLRLNLENTGN